VTAAPIRFHKNPNDVRLPPIPRALVNEANALYDSLNQLGRQLGEQLTLVYAYLDKFGPYVSTFASCSKGCSHCCSMDVQLTTLEAEYIQVHTGVPLRAAGRLTTGHRSPCPFLTDAGACGIYRFRPLVCRIFHALGDPENCRPGREQIQYGAPPQYGNDIFLNLLGWVNHVTIHADGTCRDIRDFFPHPREQVQSFLSRQGSPASI
jgi:Fe-S-cluster containining protein